MLQINRFKTTELISSIIDYDGLSESKNDVTLLTHMSHHVPTKFHTVFEKRTYLSQNSACKLNTHTSWTRNFQLVIERAFV